MRPTLDTGDWSTIDQIFPAKNLMWNVAPDLTGAAVDAAEGEFAISFPKTDGSYAAAKMKRNFGKKYQYVINEESQAYVDPALLAEYGESPLTRIVGGVCEMDCKPTPVSMQDVVLRHNMEDYTVVATDEPGGTITVAGLKWTCDEPSIDGTTYLRGTNYVGFDTLRREELTGNTHHFASKRNQYGYSFGLLKNSNDAEFKYTGVASFDHLGNPITADPALSGEDYAGTSTNHSANPTTHVLTIDAASMPGGYWPAVGHTIKPQPRMEWIAPMHSSQTAWSQNGGVLEFELQMDDHFRQFFALWEWSDNVSGGGVNGFEYIEPARQNTDNSEGDDVECPGGDANSAVRHYHNIHAPISVGHYCARGLTAGAAITVSARIKVTDPETSAVTYSEAVSTTGTPGTDNAGEATKGTDAGLDRTIDPPKFIRVSTRAGSPTTAYIFVDGADSSHAGTVFEIKINGTVVATVKSGMDDHARKSGRPPVLPGVDATTPGPEYTSATVQQHLCVLSQSDPDYVSYTAGLFKLRRYWYLEGNPYGKPANSFEWYIFVPSAGLWKRIGGALSGPWTAAGEPFSPKLLLIVNAVLGNFVRGNAYQYDTGGNSANDGDLITNRVKSIKAYQFVGGLAGGSAVPNAAGQRPNGYAATPGDFSGGSGTGIVQAADAITLAGGGNGVASPITLGDTSDRLTTGESKNVAVSNAAGGAIIVTAGSSNPEVFTVETMLPGNVNIIARGDGTATLNVFATNEQGVVSQSSRVVTVGDLSVPGDPGVGYKFVPADNCVPLRLGTSNYIPEATLTAVPDPVTPLDAIKNEYRSRVARWTTTHLDGTITINVDFGENRGIEYLAFPGSTIPATAQIRLDLFDADGVAVEGYVSVYNTFADLIQLGDFRAGLDAYGGVSEQSRPNVFVLWLPQAYIARSASIEILSDAGPSASVDIRVRMLLMGGKLQLEENFSYGSEIAYTSSPELVQTASGSYVQSRAQRQSRTLTLPMDHLSDSDRSRLSAMEASLLGRPFIVSAHPGRHGFQYRDYNLLARFPGPVSYRHDYENIHSIPNFTIVEV